MTTDRLLCALVPALLLALAPTAHAAEVVVSPGAMSSVRFTAAPGERNAVAVTQSGSGVVVRDDGAVLTPGAGCTALGDHEARCGDAAAYSIDVHLGDGDDRATVGGGPARWTSVDGGAGNDALSTASGRGVRMLGGFGDDLLAGGPGADDLGGGSGRDILIGGDGNDSFNDGDGRGISFVGPLRPVTNPVDADRLDGGAGQDSVSSYNFRARGIDVDLRRAAGNGESGENDTIVGVENVTGSSSSDRLVGTDDANRISGGGGTKPARDVIRALGGDDDINVNSSADVDAGAGNDTIADFGARNQARTTAAVRCGAGEDVVRYPSAWRMRSPTCETLRLNAGLLVSGRGRAVRVGCAQPRYNRTYDREVRVRFTFTARRGTTWTNRGYALGSSRVATVSCPGAARTARVRLGPNARRMLARAGSLPARVVIDSRRVGDRRWSTVGSFVDRVRG